MSPKIQESKKNMKLDENLNKLQCSFVYNYHKEMVNRKAIEHNASCKSDLPNTQSWELKNRDIGEGIKISIQVNLNIKLKIKL